MTSGPTNLLKPAYATPNDFDPDEFRMSIGDHLEELRRRIVLGLAGLFVAAIVCLIFGKDVLSIFCRPLMIALQKQDISPQIFVDQLADGFMVYIKISMITATAIASPWIVYQLWQFVAAGLYPHERKTVTKFVPLSLGLLITGMVFVYFMVLPWTLTFFISFANNIPTPFLNSPTVATSTTTQPSFVQAIPGNPAAPSPFQIWFDTNEGRLKMFANGKIRVIPFGSNNLLATHFTLPDYLDLVIQLLLTFGLAFQMPLVVMAIARIGIVDIPTLKSFRRYVYFAMSILAAALAPGDVITATIALMVPLILLYELGILLAVMGEKAAKAAADTTTQS
jgi:sec-independent protein translocase protein TatC